MTTATSKKLIRLDYGDEGKVVVTPADKDRFVLSMQEAATACQVASKAVLFSDQFQEVLLPKLAIWLKGHDDKVRKAFLTVREGGLLFVVLRKAAGYDSAFTDALTELDMEISHDPDLDLIRFDVLALPDVSDETAASFLAPERIMVFARAQ